MKLAFAGLEQTEFCDGSRAASLFCFDIARANHTVSPRVYFDNTSHGPLISVRQLVHDKNNVSNMSVRRVMQPLSSVLYGRKVLPHPALPEAVYQMLYVPPSTSVLVSLGSDDWRRRSSATKRQQMAWCQWLVVIFVVRHVRHRSAVDHGFYFTRDGLQLIIA